AWVAVLVGQRRRGAGGVPAGNGADRSLQLSHAPGLAEHARMVWQALPQLITAVESDLPSPSGWTSARSSRAASNPPSPFKHLGCWHECCPFPVTRRTQPMLYYALIFLVVGLIAGLLGLFGVAQVASQVACILVRIVV